MHKLILSYMQDALSDLRVTVKGMKETELARTAKNIASEMDEITAILRYTTCNCRSLYITIGVLLGEPCQYVNS